MAVVNAGCERWLRTPVANGGCEQRLRMADGSGSYIELKSLKNPNPLYNVILPLDLLFSPVFIPVRVIFTHFISMDYYSKTIMGSLPRILSCAKHHLAVTLLLQIFNTPGTRVGPNFHD